MPSPGAHAFAPFACEGGRNGGEADRFGGCLLKSFSLSDMPRSLLTALLALLVAAPAWAQTTGHTPSKERVDPLERRRDNIQGNNIRATITNWNQTAQSGQTGDFFYEYPKNTRRTYIALSQLWVGAKVTGTAGQELFIVDVADFRNNPDGQSRNRWTFQPVKGYVNPAGSAFGIAQSDDRTS